MGTIPGRKIKSPGVRFYDDFDKQGGLNENHKTRRDWNQMESIHSKEEEKFSVEANTKVQPAETRFRINEQRIKLLLSIQEVVSQRADMEMELMKLSQVKEELRRKLKKKIDECHATKKKQTLNLKQTNLKLESERNVIVKELEHLEKHLKSEKSHHEQHAKVAKSIDEQSQSSFKTSSGKETAVLPSMADIPSYVSRSVAKAKPSKRSDQKVQAARLMRDIATLRHIIHNVELRLANEIQYKKNLEMEIVRLRREISGVKTSIGLMRSSNRYLNRSY